MKNVFKLYVDELGMVNPSSFAVSPYYILLGCIIDEQYQNDLEDYANHIKFKYWGRTDVIFHSVDIAKNEREFSVFAGKDELKREFINDLLEMLRHAPVTITATIIDKEKAYKSYWSEKAVIRKTAESVLFNFTAFIYTKRPCKGKIIIEASNLERDEVYLEAFNRLLSPSFKAKNPLFTDVRAHLTSLNFVTKQNHDIEAQVADLFAYGVRCHYVASTTKTSYDSRSYEFKISEIANMKLMKMAMNMGADKRQYYELIDPMLVTPKKVTPKK